MISFKHVFVFAAISLSFPPIEVVAGSSSPSGPAVRALTASFIREKYCGKKMPRKAMQELTIDAYPRGADPSGMKAFARNAKRASEQAYNSMSADVRKKSVLCPELEKVMARWMLDKLKNPQRYK